MGLKTPPAAGDPESPARRPPFRRRVHDAWELSKPQAYAMTLLEEERHSGIGTRIERVQRAVAGCFYFVTFASIVVEVFYRYVLDQPLIWSLELPTYAFFWCFCLGASLSDWRDEQIGFDLLADKAPRRARIVAGLIANVLVIFAFVLVLPGTVGYLQLEVGQPTTGLGGISEVWGTAGIAAFFILAAILRGRLALRQAQELGILPRRAAAGLSGRADGRAG
ncbi:MAG: TRAP transporter small permease [Chloroflexota bacterium]